MAFTYPIENRSDNGHVHFFLSKDDFWSGMNLWRPLPNTGRRLQHPLSLWLGDSVESFTERIMMVDTRH